MLHSKHGVKVSLIYRTVPQTKKNNAKKLETKKTKSLRSNGSHEKLYTYSYYCFGYIMLLLRYETMLSSVVFQPV